MRVRLSVAGAVLLAPLLLWAVLPLFSDGASPTDRLDTIHEKLRDAEGRLERGAATAQLLTTDIDAYNRRIERVGQQIEEASDRVIRVDGRLRTERSELATIQGELRFERARAERLKARLAEGRRVLAQRLVELYKSDQPDLVTVVLNADGFEELLESVEFMKRINGGVRRVVVAVRTSRDEARAAATELAAAERRQKAITDRVEQHRVAAVAARQDLVAAQTRYATARSRKQDALRSVRTTQTEVQDEVRSLRGADVRIQDQLQRLQERSASTSSSQPAAPAPPQPSSGGAGGRLIWPVNGPITSPFCEQRSWESCHPGIDIGVPEGTPIRAAAAGTVVLMQDVAQSGGYGNYTCIQHDATVSTCYAHQSRFGTTSGARVSQGQVIGYVGNTGRSFGAHLHWEVRVNGAIANPGSYV